ncbi:carbonyl reductase [NADPH] 1-like [Physella acuta]|uniref:carbonyl reductase [NADPH] 1-like n=1 Tax=Physella acuta TaxID=109671 RepID=UPI0027DCD208|nr:carbonyl reductase [NADPH] 1-like [Physella acuta]
MSKRVALVTGSNKGIGFGIVRALCKNFDGDVLLTARDVERGTTAVSDLEKENLHPKFHQLDIDDHNSVVRICDFLKENYGGLDILVNNAGIAYKQASTAPFSEQADVTTKTNFFNTLNVCQVLFPLLRPHARVVNVSSLTSVMALSKCSDEYKARFTDPNITMDELTSIIKQFVQAAQDNTHLQAGFADSAYGMSKVGVTVMSMIQQRELDKKGCQDIVVNACSPGYVATDMSSQKGNLTIDEGAETPVYCALLPPNIDSPRGLFIREKQVLEWKA